MTAWAGAGSGEVPGRMLFLRLPARLAGCGSFMACVLAEAAVQATGSHLMDIHGIGPAGALALFAPGTRFRGNVPCVATGRLAIRADALSAGHVRGYPTRLAECSFTGRGELRDDPSYQLRDLLLDALSLCQPRPKT